MSGPEPVESAPKERPDVTSPTPPAPSAATASPNPLLTTSGDVEVSALTPEEQMQRFAADLLENDWGHQPC